MRTAWQHRLVLAAAVLTASFACGAHADIESTPIGAAVESVPIGPSATPDGAADPFAFTGYLQTVLALCFVLGLAVLGSAFLKRVSRARGGLAGAMGPGGPSPSGVLEILGRYPIGSGQSLVLLRFDRRVLLLHQAGGRKNPVMSTVSEVTDPEEVASVMMKTREPADDAVDASFRETIRKMERGFADHGPVEPDAPSPVNTQRQIDLLVGDAQQGGDVRAIRGKLRNWVGAGA